MDKEKLFTTLNFTDSTINRKLLGEKLYSEYVHFNSEINSLSKAWNLEHLEEKLEITNIKTKLINYLESNV